MVYSELLISCECEVCFNLVDTSKTIEFPSGSENLAWDRLSEKFESTSQASKCQIKSEYEGLVMMVNQDPEIFITDLEKLRWILEDKFSVKNDDDYLIAKIINSLPKEYDSLIDSF